MCYIALCYIVVCYTIWEIRLFWGVLVYYYIYIINTEADATADNLMYVILVCLLIINTSE